MCRWLTYLIATEIWVNIGLGNGLLPDSTKPLPKPMLTDHQWGIGAFTWVQFYRKWVQFHRKCSRYLSLIWVSKVLNQDHGHISQEQWVEWLSDTRLSETSWLFPQSSPSILYIILLNAMQMSAISIWIQWDFFLGPYIQVWWNTLKSWFPLT